MMSVFVESAGVIAPGLAGWAAAAPVLRGQAPYAPAEIPSTAPELLPANERRRASASVRLAFVAAEDAVRGSSRAPADLASVFATSEADTAILHRLCTALAQQQRVLSPTDFHNSVHNAAAGYWSIATACRQPSASISAWDATFTAGLLETAALVHETGGALLVCYDIIPPGPLHAARPLAAACAAALVLTRERGPRTLARLEIERGDGAESRMDDNGLEHLRIGNPAGRALPLLRALALAAPGAVTVAGAGSSRFRIAVAPC
ncbi:MAG: beta-ketoacyl synthase chain length factor [Gammaproteobacteria bacterium]